MHTNSEPASNKVVPVSVHDARFASYDTIRVFVRDSTIVHRNFLAPFNETVYLNSGHRIVKSHLDNLLVKETLEGVSIEGSLRTFLHGQNVTPISMHEVQHAMNTIADRLGIDIRPGRVRRVDFTADMRITCRVGAYLPLLASAPACERKNIRNETVYFSNGSKTLVFYDKCLQMISYGSEYEALTEGSNLLRYECQFKSIDNIWRGGLRVQDLCEDTVYIRFLNLWKANYDRITKQQPLFSSALRRLEVKRLRDEFIARGIQSSGGLDKVHEHLRSMLELRLISRLQKARLMKDLKRAVSGSLQPHESGLLHELDGAIEHVYGQSMGLVSILPRREDANL